MYKTVRRLAVIELDSSIMTDNKEFSQSEPVSDNEKWNKEN